MFMPASVLFNIVIGLATAEAIGAGRYPGEWRRVVHMLHVYCRHSREHRSSSAGICGADADFAHH